MGQVLSAPLSGVAVWCVLSFVCMIWFSEWACYCDMCVLISWENKWWQQSKQELLPIYAWYIWLANRKLKYKSWWMTSQSRMFWIQVWYILILTQYKIYQFPMSSTSMIKFSLPLNPIDTMPMISPGQGELPLPYLCHPLFPQMIGASPTQLHYKIKLNVYMFESPN